MKMLTAFADASSASAATTRSRNSSESRGHRYGSRPFNARSPSMKRPRAMGKPPIVERPTGRPRRLISRASFRRPLGVDQRRRPEIAPQTQADHQGRGDHGGAPQERAGAAEPAEQGAGYGRPQHPRQASDRLRHPQHLALLLAA